MLGIFDSGLGGLTVLAHVRRLLPLEDVVYFADQAHVPYGDRSTDELVRLLASNIAFLETSGVDAVVMGCNTSCAVAAQRGWPQARVPILDLIAAATDAVASSGALRVGVLATTATARSGAYGDALRARVAGVAVQEFAAPRLVPLVEAGTLEGPIARTAVAQACAQFALPLEALVLACTHYPLLDAQFASVLGRGVRRIDPAQTQANLTARYVERRGGERGTGRTTFVTTGDLASYRTAVNAVFPARTSRERFFAHASAAFANTLD